MDLHQYLPQIIAGVLVLAGGGSLQYQASDDAVQRQTYATGNGETITHLLFEVSKLKNELATLKEKHNRPG